MKLLRSPKDCGYESGCTLLKLYCYWSNKNPTTNTSSESESKGANEDRGTQLCEMLLAKYEMMLEKTEDDFLAVVIEDPMHGTLSGFSFQFFKTSENIKFLAISDHGGLIFILMSHFMFRAEGIVIG